MPGCGYVAFWETDPKRWGECLCKVYDDLKANGMNPRAPRFRDIQRKRARKLFMKKA
jgi:hypothetical protein